jgi:hypothetical protein
MTLVVAHRISTGVRLAADLRVTDPNAARVPGYLDGALKAIVVHPRVCIAFAGGPVNAALDAIRGLQSEPQLVPDLERIGTRLLEAHRRARGAIDFLVAGFAPTELARIQDDVITWDLPTAWLGDYKAFERFQEKYLEEDPVAAGFRDVLSEKEYQDFVVGSRSTAAMRAVVDSEIPTVGEAAVFVVPRPPADPTAFSYLELSSARTGMPRAPLPGVTPLQAGSAAHGDFSVAILTPEPGVGALGIYFLEGRLGLLYHPLKYDEPERFHAVSVEGFKDEVRCRHGIVLGGIGIGAQTVDEGVG